MSRRTRTVATLVALPLALGGCGLGSAVVGIHDAPAESSEGASITEETARDVATRVLDEASSTRKAGADESAEERAKVLSGPALREADAEARTQRTSTHSAGDTGDLEVLAVSSGKDWPRAVLATSQTGQVQSLYVFVAEGADRPYTLFADVPMAAGASVPALASLSEGTPVTVAKNTDKEVTTAVSAWAKGVAHPAPKKAPSGISLEDAYSTALQKNAQEQEEDFDDLAEYRQRQARAKGQSVSFGLKDGGQLSFVPMTRTDTVTASEQLKEVKIEDPATRRSLDTSSVKKGLSIKHAETLAIVTPESGKAKVVGLSEALEAAQGS